MAGVEVTFCSTLWHCLTLGKSSGLLLPQLKIFEGVGVDLFQVLNNNSIITIYSNVNSIWVYTIPILYIVIWTLYYI